jgi:hypothetical protein
MRRSTMFLCLAVVGLLGIWLCAYWLLGLGLNFPAEWCGRIYWINAVIGLSASVLMFVLGLWYAITAEDDKRNGEPKGKV